MYIKLMFLMSIFGITAYQVLLKILATLKINNLLVLPLIYLSAFLISMIFILYNKASTNIIQSYNIYNVFIILLLGGVIILIEFSYLEAYKNNVNVSIYGMYVMIISIILMLFIGKIFFHESISFTQIIGVLFVLIGLFLVKVNPF